MGEAASARSDAHALRAFEAGELSAVDAAEVAGLELTAFLDLVDRVRRTEASRGAAPPADPGPVPELSVVIPLLNEAENLGPLLAELAPVLDGLGTYEIVFVDDGSTDGSRAVVLAALAADPRIRLVELTRNFGHQGALTAGFDHARGDALILMDADLQDPPSVLPELVARWREGHEVVYAVRAERKEGPALRAGFYLFYRVLGRIAEVQMPVDSGDFCLMDRRVVDSVRALPETNRFLRGLRSWVGYDQVGVTYERAARHAGRPKYSIAGRVRLALDGLLSFSDVPLRVASFAGFLTTFVAVVYGLVALVQKAFGSGVVKGWASIVFVELALGGIQLMMLGVIGEYLSRVYQEAKRRPPYVVREVHGGPRRPDQPV